MSMSRTNVHDLTERVSVKQPTVSISYEPYVLKIAGNANVAKFNHWRTAPKMRNDLGNKILFRLPYPRVVKGAGHDNGQAITPKTCHLLHGKLADSIIISW